MSILSALITNPSLVLRHRNIFLLSHMRANTSLFGHLIGSHPQVEGYYEMHIGYYSWKSLWRQKLRHFASHRAKTSARCMFDKILHSGHHVAPLLLQHHSSRTIVMLRAPEQSIKSLIVLYGKRNPHLPEATAAGAAAYYCERVTTLARMAEAVAHRYFYLDAECLIADTEATLAALTAWLGFDTPIATEYDTFANTGRGNSGDHSARLKTGKINRSTSDYSAIDVPAALMQQAEQAYQAARTQLIRHSQRSATLAAPSPQHEPVQATA